MADLRLDASTGRWVAVAPGRTRRPGATAIASDEREDCPFCAGHEDRTPPETLLLGDGPTGWDVRVVPNLYPGARAAGGRGARARARAFDRRALGRRRSTSSPRPGSAAPTTPAASAFPFINEGHDAGASLPHSHSQLAWLPAAPPAAVAEHGLPELVPVLERDGPDRRLPGREPRRVRAARLPGGGRAGGPTQRSPRAGAAARRRADAAAARDPRRVRADQRLAARGQPTGTSRSSRARPGWPGSSSAPVSTSTRSHPRRPPPSSAASGPTRRRSSSSSPSSTSRRVVVLDVDRRRLRSGSSSSADRVDRPAVSAASSVSTASSPDASPSTRRRRSRRPARARRPARLRGAASRSRPGSSGRAASPRSPTS